MTISDDKLNSYFSKKKISSFSALTSRSAGRGKSKESIPNLENSQGNILKELPHKIDNKSITNQQQTDSKAVTNDDYNDTPLSGKKQGLDVETLGGSILNEDVPVDQKQIDNKSITNQQQTDDKSVTNNNHEIQPKTSTKRISFRGMSPLQQKLVKYIYDYSDVDSMETIEIRTKDCAKKVSASAGTVKHTLHRLEKNNLIYRVEFKAGRSGWARYRLNTTLYRQLKGIDENRL